MRRASLLGLSLVLAASGACTRAEPDPPRTTPMPSPGTFVRPAGLPGEPCGLEVSDDHVWILTCSGTLARLPKAGGAPRLQQLDGEVLSLDGLTSAPGGLWALLSEEVSRARRGSILPVALPSGVAGPSVALGASVPMAAASRNDRGWVAMLDGRLLTVAGDVVTEVDRGDPLLWTAVDAGHLWTVEEDGDVTRRDADSGEVRNVLTAIAPEAIAARAAFGTLWVATPNGVLRIPAGSAVAEPVGATGTVNAIEPCAGKVWLSQPDFGVRSFDPSGSEAAAVALEVAPRYLACDGDMLWILAEDGRVGSIETGG